MPVEVRQLSIKVNVSKADKQVTHVPQNPILDIEQLKQKLLSELMEEIMEELSKMEQR